MTRAQFSSYGDALLFYLNTDSNQGGKTGTHASTNTTPSTHTKTLTHVHICTLYTKTSGVFDAGNVFTDTSGFGSGFYCFWVTKSLLKLTFGSDATLLPTDVVSITSSFMSASSADGVAGQLYNNRYDISVSAPDGRACDCVRVYTWVFMCQRAREQSSGPGLSCKM